MKTGPDRRYTRQFRAAPVKFLRFPRGAMNIARGIKMSVTTPSSRMLLAREYPLLNKRVAAAPVNELIAENGGLRQEGAGSRTQGVQGINYRPHRGQAALRGPRLRPEAPATASRRFLTEISPITLVMKRPAKHIAIGRIS